MIKPTVGRVVWFYPEAGNVSMARYNEQPMAATVACVWGDRMVNLSVVDHAGVQHQRTSITLLQDDDTPTPGMAYCAWMPYQVGQAAKYEAAAKALSDAQSSGAGDANFRG